MLRSIRYCNHGKHWKFGEISGLSLLYALQQLQVQT